MKRVDRNIITALLRERHGKVAKVRLTGEVFDERKRRHRWAGYTRLDGERFIAMVRLGRDKAIVSDERGEGLTFTTACGMPLWEHRL